MAIQLVRHVKAPAVDAFEVLDADWNDFTSTINAVLTGNDPERPILDWTGYAIANIAKRHAG